MVVFKWWWYLGLSKGPCWVVGFGRSFVGYFVLIRYIFECSCRVWVWVKWINVRVLGCRVVLI